MSTQALNSEQVRSGIKDVLLNYANLWESLRQKAGRLPPDDLDQGREQ
jgi:hypothetical protein